MSPQMNAHIERRVKEMDKLLAEPTKHSFAAIAREIYEAGYVDGKAMQRKLTRLQLGLATIEDEKETP